MHVFSEIFSLKVFFAHRLFSLWFVMWKKRIIRVIVNHFVLFRFQTNQKVLHRLLLNKNKNQVFLLTKNKKQVFLLNKRQLLLHSLNPQKILELELEICVWMWMLTKVFKVNIVHNDRILKCFPFPSKCHSFPYYFNYSNLSLICFVNCHSLEWNRYYGHCQLSNNIV